MQGFVVAFYRGVSRVAGLCRREADEIFVPYYPQQ